MMRVRSSLGRYGPEGGVSEDEGTASEVQLDDCLWLVRMTCSGPYFREVSLKLLTATCDNLEELSAEYSGQDESAEDKRKRGEPLRASRVATRLDVRKNPISAGYIPRLR
jgi:hypothetical protein